MNLAAFWCWRTRLFVFFLSLSCSLLTLSFIVWCQFFSVYVSILFRLASLVVSLLLSFCLYFSVPAYVCLFLSLLNLLLLYVSHLSLHISLCTACIMCLTVSLPFLSLWLSASCFVTVLLSVSVYFSSLFFLLTFLILFFLPFLFLCFFSVCWLLLYSVTVSPLPVFQTLASLLFVFLLPGSAPESYGG